MLPRPLIAVLVIALGLPFLLLIALVYLSAGINSSALTSVLTITVLSIFLTLMIFEIRRIADLPPEQH